MTFTFIQMIIILPLELAFLLFENRTRKKCLFGIVPNRITKQKIHFEHIRNKIYFNIFRLQSDDDRPIESAVLYIMLNLT